MPTIDTSIAATVVALLAATAGCSSGVAPNSSGPSSSLQDAASGDGGAAGPQPFDEFQVHNLDVVNQYRATLKVAPLTLDHRLSTFALAGSTELSTDHAPHQHFINALNDNTVQAAGFGEQLAENQGDPNGWSLLALDPRTNELQQIDAIQLQMFNEGPGDGEAHAHYTNMMDAQYTRLGVGLLEVRGQLYLTNDFSN